MSLLYEGHDLVQRYDGREALRLSCLEVEEGESLALTGPNGCGKSTLLRLLAFLEQPAAGVLRYAGSATPRMEVTLLLQEAYLLRASVYDNVTLGLRLRGWRGDRRVAYETAMRAVGFEQPRDMAGRGPRALSGGERQRVALAARLVLRPRVLLLDEPTSSVDARSGRAIVEAVQHCLRQGTTVICATHDRALVEALAARELSLGRDWHEGLEMHGQDQGTPPPAA